MNQRVANRTKMLLTINLKGGKSIHLRPKGSCEVAEEDMGTMEFLTLVKKGKIALSSISAKAPAEKADARVKAPAKKAAPPASPVLDVKLGFPESGKKE